MSAPRTERRLAAILFTDIVGYTERMARDEAAGRRLRIRHRELVDRLASAYGGELLDENGDELVVCFASAVDAANCALRVQEELRGDAELRVRAGLHLGDCLFEGGRVYGDGVNVASRVRPFAEPGGVAVTAAIRQAVRGQPNLEATALGERPLKGVEAPVALYHLRGNPDAPRAHAEPSSRRRAELPLRPALGGLGLVALALLVLTWWLVRPAAEPEPIRSLAVLPLENLSGDPQQEYFADGMTDALILELARRSSLRVISRTSVMQFKETEASAPRIAAALDADALIEGSVRRHGDRVRITAQLIDARSDAHLWAQRYDRDLRDVLALQSEIARTVARRVDAELRSEPGARARPPAKPEAHEEYLKGWYFAQKHTPPAARRARQHFEKGMELDPDYPLPYAGLAFALACSPLHTWMVPAEGAAAVPETVMEEAHALASRAIALDESLAKAQTALGLVEMFGHHDWSAAERRFRRARELNPSVELAWRASALAYDLQGRSEDALAAVERAREIDPLNAFVASGAGTVYAHAGRMRKAKTLWREASELDAAHPLGRQRLGVALCREGRLEEARAHFRVARRLSDDAPLVGGDLGHCLASEGRTEEARELLRELESRAAEVWVSPIALARIHLGLGEPEAALDELERAHGLGAYRVLEIGVDGRWDPVRDHPRFRRVLAAIGLARSGGTSAPAGLERKKERRGGFALRSRPSRF